MSTPDNYNGPLCSQITQHCVCAQSLRCVQLLATPGTVMQPARLLWPWDSPGKNAGVRCHLLQGNLPKPGIKPVPPVSSALAGGFTVPPGKPNYSIKVRILQMGKWRLRALSNGNDGSRFKPRANDIQSPSHFSHPVPSLANRQKELLLRMEWVPSPHLI